MDRTRWSLDGQRALVTGASAGIGLAICRELLGMGAQVLMVARNAAALERARAELEEEFPGPEDAVAALPADVTDDEQRGDILDWAADHGGLDILVNNAGGHVTPADRSDASTMPEEDVRKLLDANFMSTMFCCQAAAAVMKRQGQGVIVNTSSQAGVTTYDHKGRIAGYAAAKAAVSQYTRYLAAELGPHGIRVNCLAPGVMLTARVAAQAAARGIGTEAEMQRVPLRRFGQVEDCAGVVEFLTTDLSRYVTGQVISVCGGAVLTPS